jgi:glycine/D-amino acid oxidase-like deaminating enzyme
MYDYLIVGQGIAGTILAHCFLKSERSVFIINQENDRCPSAVAAGIYNPITGKRMVKTWKADLLFPFLEKYYEALETTMKDSFIHKMPIYKPFGSFAEQNFIISNKVVGESLCRISPIQDIYKDFIYNPFGGFETNSSGYVNVSKLLQSSRTYFLKQEAYCSSFFQYHDLILKEDHVCWKDLCARKVIFCEGPECVKNPFFKWLPFVLTKGEMIEVDLPSFPQNVIFNKSVFIMPNGGTRYKVGSTYEWDFIDNEISFSAREMMQSRLDALIKPAYHVTGQQCGIRPTVKDRRPLIGFHPQFKTLGIFNGLGTKGISLAPYFAHQFQESIETGKELDREVNIERFYSLL